MNFKKLKEVEKAFLKKYPGGFEHPAMVEIGKKHKKDIMEKMALDLFAVSKFKNPLEITSSMVKIVSQSSMVSIFEKPKFRDMVNSLTTVEKEVLAKSLKQLLHGNEQKGFEALLNELSKRKMAKWTLMTIIQNYYRPNHDVFIKPTTAKNIILNLEIDLVYNPKPSWGFYESYRNIINKMKKEVSKSLSTSNAAFCGFLMMSFDS